MTELTEMKCSGCGGELERTKLNEYTCVHCQKHFEKDYHFKTIHDLEFESHPNTYLEGTLATIQFDNGYGASVITGPMFHNTLQRPYEIAVLDSEGITYDTPITSDVLGYLTENDANEVLRQIQELPKRRKT